MARQRGWCDGIDRAYNYKGQRHDYINAMLDPQSHVASVRFCLKCFMTSSLYRRAFRSQ